MPQASYLPLFVQRATAVLLLLFISLLFLSGPSLIANIALIHMNQAIAAPGLTYTERQHKLAQATAWANLSGVRGIMLANQIDIERQELQFAHGYLRGYDQFSQFEPGRQLLFNTTFENRAAGWIQYRSEWQKTEVELPEYTGAALVFSRQGPGHGSLSQIVQLQAGACYLFKVIGAAQRYDETRTFWLYWERFENGQRQGHNLQSESGEQMWAQRQGVFCLPAGDAQLEEVVVAPVSVYGDVTVYLKTARLYELQPLP